MSFLFRTAHSTNYLDSITLAELDDAGQSAMNYELHNFTDPYSEDSSPRSTFLPSESECQKETFLFEFVETLKHTLQDLKTQR